MTTETFKIQRNIALHNYTSIGLGGRARYFAEAKNTAQIYEALDWAKRHRLALQVLGGGSNTVFSDAGFDGLVLRIATQGISVLPDSSIADAPLPSSEKFANKSDFPKSPAPTRQLVSVQAGTNWDDFVLFCCQQGLSGLECLSGIPGSAGASPIQNVGAYGQEVADTLQELRCLDRQSLEECTFSKEECDFGYRQSRFKGRDKDRFLILEVRFLLYKDQKIRSAYPELLSQLDKAGIHPDAPASLLSVRKVVLALRKKKSMILDPSDPHSRSCGSFFMNPVLTPKELAALEARTKELGLSGFPSFPAEDGKTKIPAAWLIEQSGFAKGERYKGLGISPKHALALVNYHGTTAELLEFQAKITQAVKDRFGISLHPEPVLLSAPEA